MGSQRKTKSGASVHPAPGKRFPGDQLGGLSASHTPGPACTGMSHPVSPGGRSARDPGAACQGKQKTRVFRKSPTNQTETLVIMVLSSP